jgi:SAM-dependent methyltransferase
MNNAENAVSGPAGPVSIRDRDVERLLYERVEELAEDLHLIPEELQEWWQRYFRTHMRHFQTVLRILTTLGPGPLLEIGAVPGHLTLLISRLGHELEAVDLDPDRIRDYTAAHGIPVRQVDIEREPLPFPDGHFSVAIFTEVLEHLRWNPIFALEEMARVTRPGGRILLSVPNITPAHRFRFLFGSDYQGDVVAEFEKLKWAGHMGHFRLYSRNEVARILTHVGFREVEFRSTRSPLRRPHSVFPNLRTYFSQRLYVVATRADRSGR